MESTTLDEIDEKLLRRLHEDGRMPYDALAAEVGLSESEVRERVEALEEEGVITRFTALTDPTKLGYISVAFGITTDPTKTDSIAQQLEDHKNVYKIWILSGRHNIIIHSSFRDITDFQAFSHDILHNIDGIVRYESSIVTQSALSEGSVVLPAEEDQE
ncbi:Lrp/AsnC family transcriptional regulator [Natronosalvus caseinilyticus]|uniref:Lrp/AsnC family transcriptional regulator n=1 Tax=Natronosalvus caseinilyticus TaxID=2953747 RepID=UPI0028AF9897|nr:Lrp/AsnC family transcriptional regulator [Natronosalvus caseinilyticus]